MPQTILFDLDGTLINSRVSITRRAQAALASIGVRVEDPDTLAFFIGPPLRDTFRDVYGVGPEQMEALVAVFDGHIPRHSMEGAHVYEGIPAMLQSLRDRGRTLLLATTKPTVYAREILARLGLTPFFQGIYGSELDGARAQKDEVIAYALQKEGITDASAALMVGDRALDIHGARANGMACVAVEYGFASPGELEAARPEYTVPTVASLAALLPTL